MGHWRVWIILIVTVKVVVAVIARPPGHPTLIRCRATIGDQELDSTIGFKRPMGIKTVETYGHTQAGMPGNLQNDEKPD